MEALVLALTVWVSALTGYPMPDAQARITYNTPCELYELAAGETCPEQSEIRVGAVYDHETGTIHLTEGWQPDNLGDLSVLVHELVHHLQAESGMDMVPRNDLCSGKRLEAPAYGAQIAWLMSTGLSFDDTLAVMGTNRLFLMLVTSCRPSQLAENAR